MAQLPIKLPLELMQTKWKSILDPLIANQLNQSSILENISLASGNNKISHRLGRAPSGWFITDTNAAINVYRYQASTDLFLYLNSSAPAVVNIGVF